MPRWQAAFVPALLCSMSMAVGPEIARAATSLTIYDSFPGALTKYQIGGAKGPLGNASSGRVFPTSPPPAAYMDALPDSLAYAVRMTPPMDDVEMTVSFMLAGRAGTAPEKVVFLLKAREPSYPTTCCWGDAGQIHARSGLFLVYDPSGVWSLYEERDYATATTPLDSGPYFTTFGTSHTLFVRSERDLLDVYVDGTLVLSTVTSDIPPGLFGIETVRVDLVLDAVQFQIDCSDPGAPDADGDGTPDSCDNCPDDANPAQEDPDGDQMGDACDPCPLDYDNDSDLDGVCGNIDNCLGAANPDQADADLDGQGDICDLDDGLLLLSVLDQHRITWQTDPAFDSYNLYSGSLEVLRATGVYTQPPPSSSAADAWCNATQASVEDWSTSPAVGEVIFYLVSGNRNLVEYSLGSDSSGHERPNQNPCTHPHGSIFINGDAGFTTANGVVGGSGTAADPYVIEGWTFELFGRIAAIQIINTTRSFLIRNVTISGGGTSYGIYLSNNSGSARVEGSSMAGIYHGIVADPQQNLTVDGNALSIITSGITVNNSSPVTIIRNEISGGQYGIRLSSVAVRSVHENLLLNNTTQGRDDSSGNPWNAAWPAGGNYWTDYMGTDQCSGPQQSDCASGPDGFGDQPYAIDANTFDSYPLMTKPGSGSDTTPPVLSIAAPSDGASFNLATLTVTGTASDAGSGLRRIDLRLNGGPWTIATGTSSWSRTVTLSPGPNLIEARALDHAGNASNPETRSVTLAVPLLSVTVTPSLSTYAPGAGVNLTVAIRNQSQAPLTIHFPTGCMAFFRVETISGASLYDARNHTSCPPAPSELTLSPGQSQDFPFSWDQRNDAGAFVPAPADYVIRGYFDTADSVPTAIATVSVVTPRLDIVVRTDKTLYVANEPVSITMTYTNRTAQTVTLNFPSTCHLFFRVETPSGTPLYDMGYHQGCFTVLTSLTLQPGQTNVQTVTWSLKNDSGQPLPAPAEYVIVGYSDSYEPVPDGLTRIMVR